jgi:uncharacterized protein YbaA (DUF1428 family)
MRYVDDYVLPVPKRSMAIYRRIALKAGKIWREHGALEYREYVGDDLDVKGLTPFPRRIRLKRWRDGGVLVDRVQVTGASRSRQREGDEGQAPGRVHGPEDDAV